MIYDKNIATETAKLLLKIRAIKLQPQEPFTWSSGWKSPIYCDNRLTLSYVGDTILLPTIRRVTSRTQ